MKLRAKILFSVILLLSAVLVFAACQPTVNEYSLKLEATEGGTVAGEGNFESGASVTITATANEGYEFIGWYRNEVYLNKQSVHTFLMPNENITLKAKFSLIPVVYKLILAANIEGGGDLSGGGDYLAGTKISISATLNERYEFLGWYQGQTLISNLLTYQYTMPANDVELTATYLHLNEGNGTENDPYNIWTVEDLFNMADVINTGDNASQDVYYMLKRDLDLNGEEWNPIGYGFSASGNYVRAFQGYFDGNGKSISNFVIKDNDYETPIGDELYAGLFGYCYNATVKSLNLFGFTVDYYFAETIDTAYIGGISGIANNVEIISCNVQPDDITIGVGNKIYFGGIFGYGSGSTIKDTYVEMSADITATAFVYGGGYIGSAANNSLINNCAFAGSVSGTTTGTVALSTNGVFNGGIIGLNNNSTVSDTSVIAYVSGITATNSARVGGISGEGYSAGAIKCSFEGVVFAGSASSTATAGGIHGRHTNLSGQPFSSIAYSYSIGEVTTETVSNFAYAGGLTGYATGYTAATHEHTIISSYSTSTITATSTDNRAYAGGLAGYSLTGIKDCYATGSVSATGVSTISAGGIAGHSATAKIYNCFATGNVSAINNTGNSGVVAGGIIGVNNSSMLVNCYYYQGQTIYTKTTTAENTGIYNLGISCSETDLNTKDFYINNLLWTESDWYFPPALDILNDVYPLLEWQSNAII